MSKITQDALLGTTLRTWDLGLTDLGLIYNFTAIFLNSVTFSDKGIKINDLFLRFFVDSFFWNV
jgi:hypothetical protein